MTLRRAQEVSVSDGVIGSYVHNVVTDGLGKTWEVMQNAAIRLLGLDTQQVKEQAEFLKEANSIVLNSKAELQRASELKKKQKER